MSKTALLPRLDRPGPFTTARQGALGFAAALVLVLGTAPLASAAPRCTSTADQAIFDIEALKSELIVVATDCHVSDEYNAFVRRYQTELAENEHALDSYFKRTYGRSAQKVHDSFITDLANSQADGVQAMGADFCPRNTGLFGEVMALENASELEPFAAGQDLIPASLGACMAPPVAEKSKPRSTSHRKHK